MAKHLDVAKLEPGTVLMEKYRVVETLGVGGMGAVVACEHVSLDNRVAIKFLLPGLVSNEAVVRRFMLEARAAIKIQSDHVAKVVDVGRMTGEGCPEEGIPFMVMERLEGMDLQQWVKAGKRFSVEEVIDYIAQAGEALAQAHKQGIVHRDVKPANLFLAERGHKKIVKVLDFGISKLMEEDPKEMQLTKTSTVLGSGLYMSPEQMRSAKKVDHRTDIYSLGVCMYELFTGTQPFTAETFSELCVKVNMDPPTPLREHRPDLSDDLAEVVAMAYARDPDARYQTVQDFMTALEPFAGGPASLASLETVQNVTANRERRPSYAPPPLTQTASGTLSTTASKERRSSIVGMSIAVGAAALVLATGVGLLMTPRDRGETPAAASAHASPSPPVGSSDAPTSSGEAREPIDARPEGSATPSVSSTARPATSGAPRASAAASGSASAAPAKLCPRLDPDKGTVGLVPCD